MRRDIAAAVAAVSLLGVACANGASGPRDGEPGSPDAQSNSSADQAVEVTVASYDLAVGEDRRFIARILLGDAVLTGGEVDMQLFSLDDAGSDGAPLRREAEEAIETATGRFLAVPGLAPDPAPEEPTPSEDSAVGVYEATFDFDRPGRYGLGVIAEVGGEQFRSTAVFDVAAEAKIVEVGEVAPLVPNPTMDDDVAPGVIDSRAQDGKAVPDPQLHETTLEASLEAGNRAVVLVSTPAHCFSRLCGPTTEQVKELAEDVPPDVDVIHIEVWRDFGEKQLNLAAAAWIGGGVDVNTPWLFVVDDDGTVLGRWDNVIDLAAVRDLLDI